MIVEKSFNMMRTAQRRAVRSTLKASRISLELAYKGKRIRMA